jgi:UbiD family decarboxylase
LTADQQDLHVFLRGYCDEHPEDVLIIDDAVTPDEEVTAFVFELARQGRQEMVVFNAVQGLGARLVTNVFASRKRIATLLGTEPTALHARFQQLVERACAPQVVDSGPVLDSIEEGASVDLTSLPILRHFSSDAGSYITSGIIIAEDPDTRVANMSYHRATPLGRNELATSLHSRGHLWGLLQRARRNGTTLPVAMVIGGHPLFMLGAAARVGADDDERAVVGGLFGEPLRVVRTPRHGIGVPASADIVLEGEIDPERTADEGPFGEFTGYSSNRSTNNVLRVDAVLRRNDAVLLSVTGGNSADHLNVSRIPRESDVAITLKGRFPNVVALHYPTSGTHFTCYLSIDQQRAGEARQAIIALLGWDPYLKTVVAVDPDVDVTDDSAVLWAIATRFQPDRDLLVLDGLPGSLLDPSATAEGSTSRVGIDATKGPSFGGSPIVLSVDAQDRARTLLAGLDARAG